MSRYAGHWVRTTAPTLEPVTVAEVQEQCRIDADTEAVYLGGRIKAARTYLEEITGRAFLSQTWDLYLPAWSDPIVLPRPPLISVTGVYYTDTDGTENTLAASNYRVSTQHTPGQVSLAYNQTWPTTTLYPDGKAIRVRYVAGYGTTAASVPADLRHAIAMLAAHWYEHREPVLTGLSTSPLPFTVDALVAPYRVGWL